MNGPRGKRSLPPAAAIAAVLCCFAGAAGAQDVPNRVAEIRVTGNKVMSTGAILERIKLRVGDTFDESIAHADEQRLLDTGRFLKVTILKAQGPQGVVLTFEVTELPTVKQVLIKGNKAFDHAALLGVMRVSGGGPLNMMAVEADRQAILRKYRSEGYAFAEVTIDQRAFETEQEVVYSIVEGPQVKVRKVRYQGNEFFSDLRLWREVNTTARLWPVISGYLDMDQVDRDVSTIRNLYVEEGYLDAEVGRQLDYSDDKRDVRVTFIIHEGQRYRVNEVVFQGNKVFSGETLAERLVLRQGQFFTLLALRRDIKALEATYGEVGYIRAKADFRKQYLDPESAPPQWAAGLPGKPALVNLIFRITEEDQYHIGQVIIRGNTITQSRVIRRELRFYPTQLYDTMAVEASKKRLYETRLFEKVNITPSGKEPGVRDALVELTEGKTAAFMIGIGYSSRDGLLGNITFTQRNFDLFGWPASPKQFWRGEGWKGAGQTLTITAEPGLEVMRASIDWFEPYVADRPYSMGWRVFVFDRGREDYDETRYGLLGSLGHSFKNRWYGELAARLEDIDIRDLSWNAVPEVRAVQGSNLLLGIRGTLARNRTDSRWMPTTGDSLRLSYEQVVGSFQFGRADADYHIYRTLYTDSQERKHILAGRASVGQIFGDAPVFEKYYGGGLGSVRGFRYRGISPRSAGTSVPVGGDFLLFAGAEYSAPLVGEVIRGVVFLDTGTVERDFGITTYRASVGFGLRWVIPFFGPVPMSLDFGFPIAKDPRDVTQVVSFTLGWTF